MIGKGWEEWHRDKDSSRCLLHSLWLRLVGLRDRGLSKRAVPQYRPGVTAMVVGLAAPVLLPPPSARDTPTFSTSRIISTSIWGSF